MVQCEGEKVVSLIPFKQNVKNEYEAVLELKVTFYRKNPNVPIVIEVYYVLFADLDFKVYCLKGIR